jgi:anti-sigma28 factor (negative regulator of flagellin synthesis)
MKINGSNPGPLRPDAARDARNQGADAAAKDKAPATSQRQDSVEISDAGRTKSGVEGSSDRIQQIRARVLQGAYDTDEVVAEVARRILDRGDL